MGDEMPEVPYEATERMAAVATEVRRASAGSGRGAGLDPTPHHAGHGGSVRHRRYRGHDIEITTRYEITIDGEPWDQPIHVADDGTVHYHLMPQYQPLSLVDLMERVVDIGYAAPPEVLEAAERSY